MKKITISVILILNILVFTGCTPSYTLKPSYDENAHTLMIDSYVVNSITKTLDKKTNNPSSGTYEYKRFTSDDIKCKNISYSYYDISNSNRYYIISALDDVQGNYKYKCDVEKINNLNFFQCKKDYETMIDKVTINEIKYYYGITSSGTKESGYGFKTIVYLGSKANCFVDIREHFLNKNNSD